MNNRFTQLTCFACFWAGTAFAQSQIPPSLQFPSTDPGTSSSAVECTGSGCTTSGAASGASVNVEALPSGTDDARPVVIRSRDRVAQVRDDAATRVPTQQPRPIALSDFENYVQSTTGHALRLFGTALFDRLPADFVSPTDIAAPADYIVGPGDQVRIHTSGNVSIDVETKIDRNGLIYIPQVGSLTVAGMRLSEMQEAIRNAITKQFRNFELTVTLGQLRSIQVLVLGEARNPGVHTVSSLSTLINALFAAGGPSQTGSLRDIQLKRANSVVAHLDIYDLLLKGDKAGDARLENGDVIFIPPIGPQVAVDGDVNKPAIYELRGPTSAAELLQLAGGLTPVAATDRASIDRIVDHNKRVVQDFPLTGAQQLVSMQNGDVLRVFPISPRFDKAVTLRGNVGQPGRYPWREGMRISDLIPSRDFLITRRYFNEQNALAPALPSRPFDTSASRDAEGTNTRVSAVSQDQAAAAASGGTSVAQQPAVELGNHETEINWNYAVIERLDPKDLRTQLLAFALGEAIDNPTSPENKLLLPGDVVTIYSRNDINLPSELRARFVRIDGEVVRPGVYRVEGEETLRDLLVRAGGIAPHGYLYAAQFTRESVRLANELKLQQLVAQAQRDVLSPANQTATTDGRVNTGDLELRRAYVSALSQIHATGRVTLQIPPSASTLTDVPAVALQDGDRFFVPPRPSTVTVLGNVYNAGELLFTQQASVKHYLELSGDHTKTGDRKQEYLLRADGTVLSRETHGRFDKLMVYAGDTIIVPPRLKPGINVYQVLSISQAVSGFALAALAVRALQ